MLGEGRAGVVGDKISNSRLFAFSWVFLLLVLLHRKQSNVACSLLAFWLKSTVREPSTAIIAGARSTQTRAMTSVADGAAIRAGNNFCLRLWAVGRMWRRVFAPYVRRNWRILVPQRHAGEHSENRKCRSHRLCFERVEVVYGLSGSLCFTGWIHCGKASTPEPL